MKTMSKNQMEKISSKAGLLMANAFKILISQTSAIFLITYLATKRDDPVAPFALIPLDKLDIKNHNKKEIAVRVTISVSYLTI